jgi:peptidyl-prolyl cis-trans isomerase C
MKRFEPRLIATVALALAAAAPALAQNAPAPAAAAASGSAKVATVNGQVIPKSRVDMIVKAQATQGVPDTEDLRNAIKEELVMREIVVQEAGKKGLAKSPEVAAQLDLARQNVLWNAYRADFIKANQVTDAQVKAEYEKIKSQMGEKEYKARHILVEKEAEAKEIIVKLKKGEKFEELAKVSKDPGSKDKGGDLDWNTPAGYVKPFSDAMVKLDKGKYTDVPVQTQFGWHVIQVDDVRPMKFPPIDEVKANLQQRLQAQALEKNLAELRQKAKVE